jgi:hypothetical protein
MANTFNLGNGNWAQKTEKLLAYNAENDNYKPLPFDFDRGSSATRVNKQGLIETVGVDEPRIDFLNNTKGHLLLEPSRQNIIEYSNLESGWNLLSGGSIAYDQTISPDGTQNASILSGDGVNGNSIYDSISLSVQSYTFSVFAKQKNVSVISLKGFSGGAAGTSKFNLSNGTIDTASGGQFSDEKIENYGDGWYRCSVKVTATSSGSKLFGFAGENSDSGELFSLYGAQIEEGSYATSYIPTQGSAVTRSAETCSGAGNSTVFNDSEGVLYAEISGFVNGSGGDRTISISDGSTQNALQLLLHNTANRINFRLRSGGSLDVNISDFTFEQNEINKIACKYKSGDYALWINGEEKATSTSSSLPSGLSELAFDDGAFNDFYGNVKDIKVYNTALTDAELIALTS